MKIEKYVSPICPHCEQTTHYDLNLDRGISYLLIAIYNRVKLNGKNDVHIQNEMAVEHHNYENIKDLATAGLITFKMEKNVARARKHGLIAFVDRGSGRYLITRKGANFLRGEDVPRTAIVKKGGSTEGYWLPEKNRTTIRELIKSAPFWDIDFTYKISDQGQLF